MFSANTTAESAWLLLGLTGLGAAVGAKALWVVVGEVLGVTLAWFWLAPRFKRATDECEALTVPDYLASRFSAGSQAHLVGAVRLVAAAALTLFVTVYVSAQIDATGKTFHKFLDWNHYAGVAVGFGIVALYTLSGGFVAVVWSDLFQGLLMLIGLVSLPVAAFFALDPQSSPLPAGLLSPWGPEGPSLGAFFSILGLMAIGLGFLGIPQVFVRFIAIRSVDEIRRGRWLAVAFTLLTDTGAVATGILGRRLLAPSTAQAAELLGPGGENVFPMAVMELFPEIVVGGFIAVILAAIMSTIDSLLLVATSAISRDVYQKMFRPQLPDERLTRLSRFVTVGLSALALAISITVSFLSPDRTVFWYVIFGWSGLTATFCPMMILALTWRRYNAAGALASMACGMVCVPFFKFVVPHLGGAGAVLARAEELLPSFALALAAGVAVTLLTDRPAHGEAGSRPTPRLGGDEVI
ncbi:MAG: sodium/proline symporter [Gemmatimonadales bacterium]|nr:MAG: sodium/proline symporter [Gemmatimonadales bacterium]